ncbi:hypothetical protein [Halovivax cerinus]|uniref:Cardiolipin synthase N-terminal domain-containing protein n=1 Tax=Halovivax cerinus TaxID=1487865 RepID=A0ABD5NU27_9EURY|nr:hypothetical protein [Halovivax cerinus]
MLFALFVVYTALCLAAALWVGYDARTNSPHSPLLWASTAFFGGIVGLLLYANLGRRPHAGGGGVGATSAGRGERSGAGTPPLRDCPNCRARELASAEQCRFCGSALDPDTTDGPWFATQ